MTERGAFDAVIFDLDGTLIDSIPDVAAALNRLLESRRRRPLAVEQVRGLVGHGAAPLIAGAFAAIGAPLDDADVEAAITRYLDYYREEPAHRTTVYPGVRQVLDELLRDGVRLGICTNKPFAMTVLVLEALDLMDYFAGVTGGDNVAANKPNGAHIHDTLALMGAIADRAVMVGDTAIDVAAARNAGLPVVAVTYGYCQSPPKVLGADLLIDTFDDLPRALAKLSPGRRALTGSAEAM